MTLPNSLKERFTHLAHQPDETFALMQSALLASKILTPSAKIDHYEARLDDLVDRLKQVDQDAGFSSKVQVLKKIMIEEEGFFGDEEAYDDLSHMNIFNVLDEKCGTALTLSILFLHCAQSCGWPAHVLNFPGYSLLCIDEGAKRTVIDPFHGCVEMDAYTLRQLLKVIGGTEAELQPEYYESLPIKTLALRHLGSIKAHFLRCQQMDQGLEILEAMTCLDPGSAAFWRETGLLQARIGHISQAISSLETALNHTNGFDAIRHTERILGDLKKKRDT